MKDWKGHLIFGLLLAIAWISAIYFLNIFDLSAAKLLLLVAVVMFASLLPDVDLRKAKIRDWLSLAVAAVLSVLYIFFYPDTWYFGLAYFLILYFLLKNIPSRHRGFTHTFRFAVVFAAMMTFLIYLALGTDPADSIFWFFVAFSAYALHLLLDRT